MSQIRVNEVVSENSLNSPTFPKGAVVTGVMTATSFSGDGSQLSGIDMSYSPVAGIATYAATAGIATYAGTAGIATYATTAGIATDAQALTGTPDIAVRNIIAVGATFSGDVQVTGELTYEDVTNVDSIGVITARKGVDIRSNTLTDTTVFRYEYQYIDDEGSPQNESVSFDRVQTGAINSDNSPNTSLVTAGAVVASTVAAAEGLSGTPNITVGDVSFNGLLDESVNITAGKVSDNTDIDLADGMVHYFTTAETTTSTPNIRVDGSTSLDSALSTGETVSVTIITTAAAAAYSAALNIDGSAATVNWIGGSAPSEGGSSGLDIYTHQIIKTGSATFTVISGLSNAA